MKEIIKLLNPNQKKAVLYNGGPLSIIAGAGSGKTRTIIHKIAYLIKVKMVKPYRILAVTFTNKAANEMKERVAKLIGSEGHDVKIFTYHSLCARILRQDIDYLGRKRDFNIIDPIDQRQILRPGYKKFGLSNKTISYSSVIDIISHFKNEGITPQALLSSAKKDIDKFYAYLYKFYLEQTTLSNSLDFNDLLIFANKLLEKEDEVVEKWSKKYDYVMVDEFQDTSNIQYNIIKKISSKSIFTVVGDPDQNIYTWRYADPGLIINFSKEWDNAKTILLEQNYRSSKNILDAANKLISKNKDRIPKNLFTENDIGEKIEYHHGFSEDSEARWIVNRIKSIINDGDSPNEIAVLYRSNFLTNSLEKALIRQNVNYVIYGAIKFYQREEIKDVIAYLKLINNGDPVSLKRVINIPSRFVGLSSQEKIFEYLNKLGNNTFNLLVEKFDEISIKPKSKRELAKFVNLIRKYQAALKNNSIKDVIDKFLIEINYFKKWSSFEDQSRHENVRELINNISIWEKENKEKSLNDFINEISLYVDREEETSIFKKTISLMTIHTSKGLEFKHIFIFGMSESVFPSRKTLDESSFNGLEEERRLAYVAVTRAKQKLYITSSRGYSTDYSTQKAPSRFIKELGIKPNEHSNYFIFEKKFENLKVINNLIEGDYINHEKFGKGEVLSVESKIIRVLFDPPYGEKIMVKDHKSIRKLEH